MKLKVGDKIRIAYDGNINKSLRGRRGTISKIIGERYFVQLEDKRDIYNTYTFGFAKSLIFQSRQSHPNTSMFK